MAFEAHRPEHCSGCRGILMCKTVIFSEETKKFSKCLGKNSTFAIGLKVCFKKGVFVPNSVQTIAFSNLMAESQLTARGWVIPFPLISSSALPPGVAAPSASPPVALADVSFRWRELPWTCCQMMSWKTRSLTTMPTRRQPPSRSRQAEDLHYDSPIYIYYSSFYISPLFFSSLPHPGRCVLTSSHAEFKGHCGLSPKPLQTPALHSTSPTSVYSSLFEALSAFPTCWAAGLLNSNFHHANYRLLPEWEISCIANRNAFLQKGTDIARVHMLWTKPPNPARAHIRYRWTARLSYAHNPVSGRVTERSSSSIGPLCSCYKMLK